MTFRIISEKVIEITHEGVTKVLKFKILRAFTVFVKLLESYPNWMDIHSLDGILGDPNRAMSDLKNDEGYSHFLTDRRNDIRNLEYKVNLNLLFDQYEGTDEIFLSVSIRQGPSSVLKTQLRTISGMKCNISGFLLHDTLPPKHFMKNAQMIQYDHRIPLFKGGDANPNNITNWQILSELVNREKNKSCAACTSNACTTCALAFPETNDIIRSNNQNISELKRPLIE